MLTQAKIVVLVVVATVMAGLGATVWYQAGQLREERAAFAKFKGSVEALGRAQEIAAAKTNLDNLKNKERADEEYRRRIDALGGALGRMRAERDRARGSFVPEAAPGAGGAAGACFDPALLERAIGELVGRVRGLAAEGDKAVIGLDVAKEWARGNK